MQPPPSAVSSRKSAPAAIEAANSLASASFFRFAASASAISSSLSARNMTGSSARSAMVWLTAAPIAASKAALFLRRYASSSRGMLNSGSSEVTRKVVHS